MWYSTTRLEQKKQARHPLRGEGGKNIFDSTGTKCAREPPHKSNMNLLSTTLASVLEVLRSQKMDHLMIGGHVVNHYGYGRSTQDIDFMMVVTCPEKLVAAMKNAGFTSYSIEPLVLFFQKPTPSIRVDFLRVDPDTFAKLMHSAVSVKIFGCEVKIPSLPDLLAMKFFSYGQAPQRRIKDLQDIVGLSIENNLDAETVLKPLALKFASEDIYRQVFTMLPTQK